MATTKEYGLYGDIIKNPRSFIDNFLKKDSKDFEDVDEQAFK
jgi:hypothetical protein